MIKAVLFDLDGTLLPQSDVFLKMYFKGLVGAFLPLCSDSERIQKALWAGVGAMVKNNGEKVNEQVFFDTFTSICPVDADAVTETALSYYLGGYRELKKYTSPNPLAKTAVKYAARDGRRVVLATNPLLPLIAQQTRMSWVGLDSSDFEFVTSYESNSYSKPNPMYYRSICDRLGVLPEECLMIGNDEEEDLFAAQEAGMNCYLVEGCVIPSEKRTWHGEHGSFEALVEKLKNM